MCRNAITEADLERCGLTIVGDEVLRSEDATPDPSWGRERLVAYADAKLTISQRAEQESLLQARKSAVALFWAGCALHFIRADCKARGEWTKLKRERGWKDTTANDAIRLYKNAKTPDALAGLGITEAKVKYVYPDKRDDEEEDGQEESSPTLAMAGGQRRKPSPMDAVETSEPAIVTELSDLAQSLNEIVQRVSEMALDDLGKVESADLNALATALAPVSKAVAAVSDAVEKLYDAINRRLPDA